MPNSIRTLHFTTDPNHLVAYSLVSAGNRILVAAVLFFNSCCYRSEKSVTGPDQPLLSRTATTVVAFILPWSTR